MRVALSTIGSLVVFAFLVAVTFPQTPSRPTEPAKPSPTPPSAEPSPKPGEEVSAEDVIKVTTNLVTSNALVVGRDRKYVPSLPREDFHIFDNGVEQQVAYFAPVDRPFTVALIIDNSRSTAFELREIQNVARAFVRSMGANDQAAIVSLSDDFKSAIGPTNNHEELLTAISGLKPAGATRLYDAVDFSIKQAFATTEGRKAIILLTDGVDNDSRNATYQSNLNLAANASVQIYAVQFSTYDAAFKQAARIRREAPEGSGFNRIDYERADAYLHQITDLTGASVFPAANVNDLDAAIAGITEELHNEYTLGFYPRNPGKQGEIRRLEVRVSQPQLRVRSRASYSIGPSLLVRQTNQAAPAALTDIESRTASHFIPENSNPLNARWICKGPFVPGDYALVQEGYDSKCPPSARPNDQTNAWFIKKPGMTETVCKGFFSWNGSEVDIKPIPTGYAVVGETDSSVCSKSSVSKNAKNAWLIKRPSAETTVCMGFLIPRGFVVVNEKKVPACPATVRGPNAWIILPASPIETRGFYQTP